MQGSSFLAERNVVLAGQQVVVSASSNGRAWAEFWAAHTDTFLDEVKHSELAHQSQLVMDHLLVLECSDECFAAEAILEKGEEKDVC